MKYRSLSPALCLAFTLSATGCGVAPDEVDHEGEPLGESAEEIKDGYETTGDPAVVGIVAYFGNEQGLCTGSLIAPNLVLTAQHCVANIENTVGGGVLCGTTTFTAPEPPENFFVTTKAQLTEQVSDYRRVREVVIPPDANDVCGDDVAMLILDGLVPPEEAPTLVPRIDEPLVPGEAYYAVGYGGVDDAGSSAGVRRRRDDLCVSCVAETCNPFFVTPTEWQGDAGICIGDSGGPALDLGNRVAGVTSRGLSGCEDPIYGHVSAWAAWIQQTALHAADLGGYAPLPWATGFPTNPVYTAPVGDACSGPETCAGGICDGGTCTRPCTEIAACPGGYTCEGEPGTCAKLPEPRADADDAEDTGALCSVHLPGADPTKPVPWIIGGALGALALLRRRRPLNAAPAERRAC